MVPIWWSTSVQAIGCWITWFISSWERNQLLSNLRKFTFHFVKFAQLSKQLFLSQLNINHVIQQLKTRTNVDHIWLKMHPCLPWAAMCQILIDGGAKVRMDPGATSHRGYAARPLAPRRRNPVLLCPTCHRHALFAYQITQFDCMSCYIHFSFLLLLEWKPSKTSPFLIFPDFSHSNSLFGQNWNSTIKKWKWQNSREFYLFFLFGWIFDKVEKI